MALRRRGTSGLCEHHQHLAAQGPFLLSWTRVPSPAAEGQRHAGGAGGLGVSRLNSGGIASLWSFKTEGSCRDLGFIPEPWAAALPGPCPFRRYYRLYISKQRAPQQSPSKGTRKLSKGYLDCLSTKAGTRAARAGRWRRVTQLSG